MSRQSCLVVMYHYVRDSARTPFPGIRALAPEAFVQQLEWLQEHYEVIPLARLEAALDGRASLPPNAALLTFDDGFADHHDVVLPVLRNRGLSGVFFTSGDACGPSPKLLGVHKAHFLLARLGAETFGRAVLARCGRSGSTASAGPGVFGRDSWEESDDLAIKHLINYQLPFADAERVLEDLFAEHIGDSSSFARSLYLSPAMVGEMTAAGMVFGYHTRSHRMLSRLTLVEQEDELRAGVEWIRSLTGQRSVPFCYPWGGPRTYTGETVRLLGAVGYSLAFNTVRRRAQLGRDGRYELPRVDTRDLPPHTEHDAVMAAAGEA
jgi:peptidoglycan/xylan/chitin deacetylase (PgdA/CDA1 family)